MVVLGCVRSLLLLVVAVAVTCSARAGSPQAKRLPLTQRYPYTFAAPRLTQTAAGTVITVEGCDSHGTPGFPQLPLRGVVVAVPAGYRPDSVTITPGKTSERLLDAPVVFAPMAVPLSADPRRIKHIQRDAAVYSRRSAYPDYESEEGRRWRVDRRRGADELALVLYPVQVIPADNRLLCHGEITVEVQWLPLRDDKAVAATTGPRPLSLAAGESDARETGLSILAPGPFAHVIIAPSLLTTNIPGPWNLDALVAARGAADLASVIVTTEWIYDHYAGRDDAERIRTFLRDAYQTWRTRYTLLVGTAQLVPTRQLYCSFDENTAMIPSDGIYYGCLDGDFDYNGNNVFGEIRDGVDGGDVDLVAEIYVGRFPVANATELARMVRKTLAYEALPATRLARVASIGEYLGFGGEADYATGAMEQIRLGAKVAGGDLLGFENPDYNGFFDTSTTLYDASGFRWPKSQMLTLLNQDVHVFNHLGHGAARTCFKINVSLFSDRQAIAALTNDLPSLAYSQACESGRFDDVTDCFAEQLVTAQAGAFAAVMNPRFGWGYLNQIGGPSHRFHQMFWDSVFRGEAHTLGGANARSKERLRHLVDPLAGDVYRWCLYEITLFGDPATPFAARLLQHPPEFGHAGLENSFNTTVPYEVVAEMGPAGLIDPTTPRLLWRTTTQPGVVYAHALTRAAPGRYTAAIPAQPMGTTIHYTLRAETLAGVAGRWPEMGEHAFTITPPLTLDIRGVPTTWGAVAPTYGEHTLASGMVVRAEAPARVVETEGVSRALLGYTLSGSVTTSAPLPAVTFVLDQPSVLTWRWQTEHALQHTSNVPGLLQQTIWLTPATVTESAVAPDTKVWRRETYAFAGWYLDGQRQPEAPGAAANPVTHISMAHPHRVYAHYLPLTQDEDGNGIPDWWEYRYFGTVGHPADADDDGDGYNTAQEYADRTDPLDAASYPQPPLILHDPLATMQQVPPPYEICATITDSFRVETALLLWRRNGGLWQTNTLARQGTTADLYCTEIVSPGFPRDRFDYLLQARDPAGYEAVHGPHTLTLTYPQIGLSPADAATTVVQSGATAEVALTLTNAGNAALTWQLGHGIVERVTATPGLWETNALGQAWTISTNRRASPPFAFHGKPVSGGGYVSPAVHAGLLSPPFELAPGARLFFKHWIASELNTRQSGSAFDGGLVEISIDDGATFQQLDGPYSHRIAGWTYSPWPDGTPCFAGDGSTGWSEVEFPLEAFAGQRVRLLFHYGGDNNSDGEGWYVDDIRVGPVSAPAWPAWLACGATAGTLIADRGFVIPAYLMAAGALHRDELLSLHFLSNDPLRPNVPIDMALTIRDPPWLGALEASQTSIAGEGVVTISATVAEVDGEPLHVEVAYSSDDGTTWALPSLFHAETAFGTCQLQAATSRVAQVATTGTNGLAATNRVTILWNTQSHAPPLSPVVAGARVRLRAVSPYFASPEVVSTPFLVDNEAPTKPGSVAVTTHAVGEWSRAATLRAQWRAAMDGAGIGDVTYRWKLWETPYGSLTNGCRTPGTSAAVTAPSGSNLWFAVQAVDAFGNASGEVALGPYRVDTIAPCAGNAFLQPRLSPFGPYAVGPQFFAAWGGFSDAHSGIAGYVVTLQAEGVLIPPSVINSTSQTFTAASLGVTNRVLVHAIDRVGNTSPTLSCAVWVLDPASDTDGDGFSAADEELAGTNAADPTSVLRIGLAGVYAVADTVTLDVVWQSVAGRRYTLLGTPSLTDPDWQSLPGFSGIPGTGNVVTNAVTTDAPLFLRLLVEPETP